MLESRGSALEEIAFSARDDAQAEQRINGELDQVERGVMEAIGLLKPGGRLVVISFHSLEDRLVKTIFRQEAKGCICPPRLHVYMCGQLPRVRVLTRKGLRPSAEEVAENPRSRSAVLRAVERC